MSEVTLLMDANVLIDYARTDRTVLGLASATLGPVVVLRQTLRKVDQLDEAECQRLGARIAEPELKHLVDAGQRRGQLAFDDRLCLVVARDCGWTCITNDRRLRAACTSSNVSVMWGLQIMVELVENGALTRTAAASIARAIHQTNPRHINPQVLARFNAAIGG